MFHLAMSGVLIKLALSLFTHKNQPDKYDKVELVRWLWTPKSFYNYLSYVATNNENDTLYYKRECRILRGLYRCSIHNSYAVVPNSVDLDAYMASKVYKPHYFRRVLINPGTFTCR